MQGKRLYVVLAFHGHEPIWDLTRFILEDEITDPEMRASVPSENWIQKRLQAGRDIYQNLIDFAVRTGIPITLEASNELLNQIGSFAPGTFRRLQEAYRSGSIYPLYGHAHHAHITLLTNEEMIDEVRLNQEYLHDVMGVPKPRHRGLFPAEASLDARKLRGLERLGIEFVIFPTLDRRKMYYEVSDGRDPVYEPFLVGEGTIALPRHFCVSQCIWRPITKWKVDSVKSQGYLLGHYWVLPEEYQEKRFVDSPITREEAIDEYAGVLRKAIADAPDCGLILYVQDLELMDFGDVALDVIEQAWKKVTTECGSDVCLRFVTPDDYLDEEVMPRMGGLRRVRFHQASWAPEIRVVLRYDGHYPPLDSGRFREMDLVETVFRRWPFIFWEPGRYLVQVLDGLADTFGLSLAISEKATELERTGYRPGRLSRPAAAQLHLRLVKRACNWGWFPNEGLNKRGFLSAYRVAELMLEQISDPSSIAGARERLRLPSAGVYRGLERLLEVLIDTRWSFLAQGIIRLKQTRGRNYAPAFRALAGARVHRDQALYAALCTREAARALACGGGDFVDHLRHYLASFRDYCREVFLSIDQIQRAWMEAGDTETLLTNMYHYLYELYPPRFPAILESTLTEEELREAHCPKLV